MSEKRARDCQRGLVYDFHTRYLVPRFEPFYAPDFEGGEEEFHDSILVVADALRAWGVNNGPVKLEIGRRNSVPQASSTRIILPPCALRPLWVLHEAAHTIESRLYGRRLLPWHGPMYMRIMLNLVASHFQVSELRLEKMAVKWGCAVADSPLVLLAAA